MPTTEGRPSERAMMTAWYVAPPWSRTSPLTSLRPRRTDSDGNRSLATTMGVRAQRVQPVKSPAEEAQQYLVLDVPDIRGPGPQVLVVGILEYRPQGPHVLDEGRLGSEVFCADDLDGSVLDIFVFQHRQLGIEDLGEIVPVLCFHEMPGASDFVGNHLQGVEKPIRFASGQVGRYPAPHHGGRYSLVEKGLPDSDTWRCRNAVQNLDFVAHAASSKLLARSPAIAAAASPSSEPSASTSTVAPCSAASIITPMILLPLIRRMFPFDRKMSASKFAAAFTSRVAGRAWIPSRFAMTASLATTASKLPAVPSFNPCSALRRSAREAREGSVSTAVPVTTKLAPASTFSRAVSRIPDTAANDYGEGNVVDHRRDQLPGHRITGTASGVHVDQPHAEILRCEGMGHGDVLLLPRHRPRRAHVLRRRQSPGFYQHVPRGDDFNAVFLQQRGRAHVLGR